MRAVAVPEGEWQRTIEGFGFSPEAAGSYREMMRGFNPGHIVFEGGGKAETRRGETTIEEFAVDAVKQQKSA